MPMTDRDALARLTQALDAYFAAKAQANDDLWIPRFNALMQAMQESKQILSRAGTLEGTSPADPATVR